LGILQFRKGIFAGIVGLSLEGRERFFGTGTPGFYSQGIIEKFFIALHQKGLLSTAVPE